VVTPKKKKKRRRDNNPKRRTPAADVDNVAFNENLTGFIMHCNIEELRDWVGSASEVPKSWYEYLIEVRHNIYRIYAFIYVEYHRFRFWFYFHLFLVCLKELIIFFFYLRKVLNEEKQN
jgi:hypothetical protein